MLSSVVGRAMPCVSGGRADIVVAVVVSEGPCEGVKAGPLSTWEQVEQAPGCGNYRPPP